MKNGNKYSGFVFLIQDYKNLLNHLDDKLSSVIKNNKMKNCQSTLEYLEMSIDQPKKYVIDYISLWDTWIPQLALNWLISHPRENWRFNFVDLLLKEQPDKNFWEALQRVCKAWEDMRNDYRHEELFDDDDKSHKIKLEYCHWLKTEPEKRSVKLYTYRELVKRLQECHRVINEEEEEEANQIQFNLEQRLYSIFSTIRSICFCDADTPEELFNWIIAIKDDHLRHRIIRDIQFTLPEKNFWEALQDICKIWNDLRSKYSYNELIAPENKKKIDSILFWFYWSKVKSASIFLFK